jgi:hypothetical protein
VLPVDAIARASRAFLINSVRRLYEVRCLAA